MKITSTLICLCISLAAWSQEQVKDLKDANKELFQLTDSLKKIEKLLSSKKIDSISYLSMSGEVLYQMGNLAYSNYSKSYVVSEPDGGAMADDQNPGGQDTVPDFGGGDMPTFGGSNSPMDLIMGNGRRTSFKIKYSMFWNGLKQNNEAANITYPDFNIGKSFNWFGEFDVLLHTKLGKKKGPFALYYGIGWDNRKFTHDENVQKLISVNDLARFSAVDTSLDQSSIRLGYFRIPVGLEYKAKKFKTSVGAYLGFLTSHKQELSYTTNQDEDAKLQLDKDYGFEKTVYGLSATIGTKRIGLTVNYDLSTLFKDNDDFDYNAWRIGITLF
ncbi:MAG TPA: outer membrane beta-barrel protein [Saprospiraceae bacterium]|nr:outer membrane beta-barrel protein [Saprospiraceae bacterium]